MSLSVCSCEALSVMTVPQEAEFKSLPGLAVVERAPEDGYWCYDITDPHGVTLRLSFDILQRSVQADFLVDRLELVSVSQEGATALLIGGAPDEPWIRCEFRSRDAHGSLQIAIAPRITMRWATLVDEERKPG